MKINFLNKALLLMMIAALFACEDDIPSLVTEIDYDRVFSPSGIEARVTNDVDVRLTWNEQKDIKSYTVEFYTDSVEYLPENLFTTVEGITPDQLPFEFEGLPADTIVSARIKGISSIGVEDSKWSGIAFQTYPENLFKDYDVWLTAIGEVTVSWTPGRTVTSLLFISESGETTYEITPEEMEAGSKTITDVPNDDYTINLMNGKNVRGFQDYIVEGDVVIASGEDLTNAITAANPGDVILLEAGGMFGFEGDFTIDKSIKIKGLDGALPVLYVTSGDRMFYIGSNLTPSDYLVFENLLMSGYVNYDSNGSNMRGVFDMEGESCNIDYVKFLGCEIRDMGRHLMRLRGGADQTIGELIVDDCIVSDMGASSGSYGLLSATATNTNVVKVKVTNSTIYSFKCHFMRYDKPSNCESIEVRNCTFDTAPGKGRYIMDLRSATITSGVTVSNCIFGNTTYGDTPSVDGIRVADGVNLTIFGTYGTTDFIVKENYAFEENLTRLEESSTSLWADPANGDFSFIGTPVEAGDPRWR
nr:DUF5123 domain-containing protein [uncultured Carboxylicivirga sp.]